MEVDASGNLAVSAGSCSLVLAWAEMDHDGSDGVLVDLGSAGGDLGTGQFAGDAGGDGGCRDVPAVEKELGRPPFDPMLKFRVLVLQSLHGLSLEQTEYLVRDRLSWMRFCQLGPGDRVPDANTLWDFREALIAAGALDDLFERLDKAITAGSINLNGMQIIGASERQLVRLRGDAVATVFQEPLTALDPLMPLGREIAGPVRRRLKRTGGVTRVMRESW